jgi:AmiR/NasT family two-component response regulator
MHEQERFLVMCNVGVNSKFTAVSPLQAAVRIASSCMAKMKQICGGVNLKNPAKWGRAYAYRMLSQSMRRNCSMEACGSEILKCAPNDCRIVKSSRPRYHKKKSRLSRQSYKLLEE